MYQKEEIRELLDKKSISYEWMDHEAAFTIDDMVRMGLDQNLEVAKNLFLRDAKGKNHYLIVVRADKRVDLKKFAEAVGLPKLSFASEERLQKYLGLKKGAVTPFGVLNDAEKQVQIYFDRDFIGMHRIGVHPNDNTASVFLSVNALIDIIVQNGHELNVVEIPV